MRILVTGLVAAAALAAAGCYGPNPGFMSVTGSPVTYWSTESKPTTITVVDTRTEEVFFTIEIPVGKQLTLQFQDGDGDDPVHTPDLMKYEVFKRGTRSGLLNSSLTVPNQYCRRIDVSYRPAPEAEPPPADKPIRTDQDRPSWWTPEGGPMPQRPPATMGGG